MEEQDYINGVKEGSADSQTLFNRDVGVIPQFYKYLKFIVKKFNILIFSFFYLVMWFLS